jgi:NADPH-dependent curcumin reductase CurA
VLLRSIYLSLDPYMRGRMSDADSCARPVAIGEVMTGGAVARVMESRDPAFRAGDAVAGMPEWQEYAVFPAGELRKIDPGLAPISTALGVGGAVTDAVLRRINTGARIAVCGQISQYNLETPESGPRWLGQLIVKQAKVQGFLVSGFADRFPEGLAQLAEWLKQGKLKYREDVAHGIEAAPKAFIGMLQGKNQGKQLVQLSEL